MTLLKMPPPGAGAPGGGEINSVHLANCSPWSTRTQPFLLNRFIPPRLAKLLLPLNDPTDVEFAIKLRAAMRRNVNRGRADAASWCSALAAELVLRRA